MGLRGWRTYHRTSAGSSLTIEELTERNAKTFQSVKLAGCGFGRGHSLLEDAEAEAG